MDDDVEQRSEQDRLTSLVDQLDTVLANLEQSLAALTQVANLASHVSRQRARIRSGGEESDSSSSFWRVLKEFTFPYSPPRRK